ncbi:redoxin domain-containing protein [Thalassotalea agarivorans]|uniref:Alkyl hydroperoxide reductase subunit AhpC (Peroxiredoxin) n=1 Tax=Thalassotalea agarivorans TaxID=349064 RepID=A0A1I0BIS4_THASX|nr:redoxin domain-containing protein [Thalassotalea agarivorans]SET06143.1 Alkyl hydroperoxide reductase subunit AhpC (peroxiredoxin) [Thalassotalea agarivorans]
MSSDYTSKLHPGVKFPSIEVTVRGGDSLTLGQPQHGLDWQMVVIYRGRHCPLCTKYLNQLQTFKAELAEIGVDLVAASGDSEAQLREHMSRLELDFPLGFGLTTQQMTDLGTYISDPRSPQETDHPFAEPALFVVNSEGTIQVVDYSNNPFVRPELRTLVNGLAWIRNPENNYPIRGMHR